jgi:hypothetical protein
MNKTIQLKQKVIQNCFFGFSMKHIPATWLEELKKKYFYKNK